MEICDVLVVDDSKEITKLYEELLRRTPFSFEIVNSGEDAIEIIKRVKFLVYILDINLGNSEFTGVDLAIKIRKIDKKAKLFAVTGNAFVFDKFDPKIAGFNKVFKKPFWYNDIMNVLTKALENKP